MTKYYLCKTQEEYNWLMKKLEKEGYRWNGGDKLSSANNFTPEHYTLIECWSDGTILYEDSSTGFIESHKEEFKGAIQVSELIKEEESKGGRRMNNLIIAKDCTLGMYDGSDYSEQQLISGRVYKVNVTLEAEYICFDGKYISMETDSGLELFFKPEQINEIVEVQG